MLVLAIESSTRLASVALATQEQGQEQKHFRVLAEASSDDPKSHSEFLNPAVEKCLQSSGKSLEDIDLFAVGIGPGSFTGIRVAVNIVRAFSFLSGKPTFVKDSLSLLQSEVRDRDCITILNAYKNMVYFRAFKNGKPLCESQAINAVNLEAKIHDLGLEKPVLCLGDGFSAYASVFSEKLKSRLNRDPSISDFPQAKNLAQIALENSPTTLDWKSIIPLYLRASTAEENLQSK
jgi:tRNA threonylcarbamoyladenosine biosynthesis protein TsaB